MLELSNDSLTIFFFFFFNDTATTEIYTLSLHDALPILSDRKLASRLGASAREGVGEVLGSPEEYASRLRLLLESTRSEEHTSELQSRSDLVCRLLLEKKIYDNVCASLRQPSYTLRAHYC